MLMSDRMSRTKSESTSSQNIFYFHRNFCLNVQYAVHDRQWMQAQEGLVYSQQPRYSRTAMMNLLHCRRIPKMTTPFRGRNDQRRNPEGKDSNGTAHCDGNMVMNIDHIPWLFWNIRIPYRDQSQIGIFVVRCTHCETYSNSKYGILTSLLDPSNRELFPPPRTLKESEPPPPPPPSSEEYGMPPDTEERPSCKEDSVRYSGTE